MKIISKFIVVINCLLAKTSSGDKVKRVLNGDIVKSHEQWNTYHVVALMNSWSCVTNQINHEVGGCQQYVFCTGSILSPSFVITAAHCASYRLFHHRSQRLIHKVQPPIGFFGRLYVAVNYFIIKESAHKFYSTIAILAGSPEIEKMDQRRHAERVFPHPFFTAGNFSLLHHDVAIIRVCKAFVINKFVKIAPMVGLDSLKTRWEDIVSRNAACLFVGFGRIDNPNQPRVYNRSVLLSTRILRFTWRQMTCSSWCNKNWTSPDEQHRNPCLLCSTAIHPRIGSTSWGDSGSPITCDGFYTGVHTSGANIGSTNFSSSIGYGLHCIKSAITQQRQMYYMTVKADEGLEFLGPIDDYRKRRDAVKGMWRSNYAYSAEDYTVDHTVDNIPFFA